MPELTARLRTAITLAVLALLMVLGLTWGWAQATKPFPGKVDAAVCVDTTYEQGEELFVQDVTVSVLNASGREGLAGRTMSELTAVGFAEGSTGNAPEGTTLSTPAEIWTDDVESPAAKLLRARLGKVPIVSHPEVNYPGIVVVVGDTYQALQEGPASVVLDTDTVVCRPPLG